MSAPHFSEPVRVAFLGEPTSANRALHDLTGDLQPRFFAIREGMDRDELAMAVTGWGAQVVVALDASKTARRVAKHIGALTLGLDRKPHRAFDRTTPDWRATPLAVDDRLYSDAENDISPSATPRTVFIGASSYHRERFLIRAKHEYDLLHYAHGLRGDELREVLDRTDIAINLHREPGGEGFEHRVLMHLAAGQLLLSEPLSPTQGLEPGTDYLEFTTVDELMALLHQLQSRPDAFDSVRRRGRAKADDYRASRIWPRVIADLLEDARVFASA